MPRLMHGDEGELFRAVITIYELRTGDADPSEYTSYVGPFGDGRQAAAAITRATRDASTKLHDSRWWATRANREPTWEDILVEGTVQRTAIHWEAP